MRDRGGDGWIRAYCLAGGEHVGDRAKVSIVAGSGSWRRGQLRRPERRARACSAGRAMMIFGEVSPGSGTGRQAGEGAACRIVKVSLFCVAGSTGPSKVHVASTMRAVLMAESPIPQT